MHNILISQDILGCHLIFQESSFGVHDVTFVRAFEVNGKTLMKGLLTRQPRKRLGSGLGGWEVPQLQLGRTQDEIEMNACSFK